MNGRSAGLGIVIMAAMAFQAPPLQAQTDTFEWSGRLGQGQVIEVRGIIGEIRAVLSSGDQVEVVARKRGERDDFHQIAIEVAEDGNRTIICAVYGDWKHGQGRCHPDFDDGDNREDRRHRNVDMDVEVDYEVRVPAGVDFDGSIVSGDIRATGLRSDVSVNTVDGEIYVETTGRAWANSVAGDIELSMGDPGSGDLDFNSVSGDITLWLPSDFAADIDFSSLSGDLDTDFEMTIQRRRGRWIGSSIEGTIGGGGRELTLHTVSGDVEIRERRR